MIKLLVILILALGCQDYNSNSGDKFRYGPLGLAAGSSTEFTAAYVILQIRCASCHSNRHSNYAGFKSEQDWKDAGLVIGGNTDASSLINRIRNYGATGSDMPDGSGPLPEDEYSALKTWVESVPP